MYKPQISIRGDQVILGNLIIDACVADDTAQLLNDLLENGDTQYFKVQAEVLENKLSRIEDYIYTNEEFQKLKKSENNVKEDCKLFRDELSKRSKKFKRERFKYKEAMENINVFKQLKNNGKYMLAVESKIQILVDMLNGAAYAYQLLLTDAYFMEQYKDKLPEWDKRYREYFSSEEEDRKAAIARALQHYRDYAFGDFKQKAYNQLIADFVQIYNISEREAKNLADERIVKIDELNDSLNLAKPTYIRQGTIRLDSNTIRSIVAGIDSVKSREHKKNHQATILNMYKSILKDSMCGTYSDKEIEYVDTVISECLLGAGNKVFIDRLWSTFKEIIRTNVDSLSALNKTFPLAEYTMLLENAEDDIKIDEVDTVKDFESTKEYFNIMNKQLHEDGITSEERLKLLGEFRVELESILRATLDNSTKALFYQLYGALYCEDEHTFNTVYDELFKIIADRVEISGEAHPVRKPCTIFNSIQDNVTTKFNNLTSNIMDAGKAAKAATTQAISIIRRSLCDIIDEDTMRNVKKFNDSKYREVMKDIQEVMSNVCDVDVASKYAEEWGKIHSENLNYNIRTTAYKEFFRKVFSDTDIDIEKGEEIKDVLKRAAEKINAAS